MMRQTLRRTERVRGKKNFRTLYQSRLVFKGKHLRCHVQFHPAGEKNAGASIGISVPRAVKRAVDRSRIKRLTREAYRRNKENIIRILVNKKISAEMLLIFRPASGAGCGLPEYKELEEDLLGILDHVANHKVIAG